MICGKCNKEFDIIYRNECKLCGFKKRNKEKYEKIINDGFWTEEEINIILYQLFYVQPKSINEIYILLTNKTLSNLVSLLRRDLPIRGQTKQRVIIECSTCKKLFESTLEFYERDRKYCSFECRNKGFILFGSHAGENNSRYNSKIITCTNCNKEFLAPKYKQEHLNSYGENNHYCSQKCYWEYRGKHYIKEKNGNYGIKFSNKRKIEMSMLTTKMICDGKMPQTMSKPHVMVAKILDKNKLKYTNEFNLKYQSLDIYLDIYNLGIEIMGDYWHSHPNKYKREDLNKVQIKDKMQDKRKHTYTKKYHGFEILYLWESDIKKDIKVCELLIKEYINKNGILQDYNSFNYYVNGNELLLQSELVKPYFIN